MTGRIDQLLRCAPFNECFRGVFHSGGEEAIAAIQMDLTSSITSKD
jgi:hypothetical protein